MSGQAAFFEQFRTASPSRQMGMIAATVFLAAMVLAALWFFLFRTSYQPIFSNLRPAEAAAIVAELEKKKTPYHLEEGGSVIAVPSDRADAIRLELASSELSLKGTAGFELFNKSDMGITDFAQKINYQRAIQGELERTISSLDGVESARVHISMGEDRLFREDRVPPKASVTLHMLQGAVPTQAAVSGIRQLVSASVPSLAAANVVVLDEEGKVLGMTSDSRDTTTLAANPLPAEKQAVENYYASRISNALDQVYGRNSISVSVTAVKEAGVQADDEAGTSPGWEIENRNFGLRVTLSPSFQLSAQEEAEARSLASGIINPDPVHGDMIVLGPLQANISETAHPAMQPRLPSGSRQADLNSSVADTPARSFVFSWAKIALITIAALAIAGIMLLRTATTRRLTEAQRMRFAERLQMLATGRSADDTGRP